MNKEYFKNKYRVATTRLQDWNYSWEGMYYVTICVKDRICCLGDIKDGFVYLSEIGEIVFKEWLRTSKLRPNVFLDDFIIMPNYIHGIIVIEDNDLGLKCRDTVHRVSTKRKFGNLPPKLLSSIINTFKGAVTRQCNKKGLYLQWQTKFYDHIIRNKEDYARIKAYIANNPINWQNNRNNPATF